MEFRYKYMLTFWQYAEFSLDNQKLKYMTVIKSILLLQKYNLADWILQSRAI